MSWAETEFKDVDFGDKRLNSRIVRIATTLAAMSAESIPAACRGWQETKATYRSFDNKKITAEKILSAHIAATKERMRSQKRVLLLQDTSELDYSNHFSKEGIGYLNGEQHKGFLIHPLFAIGEDRLPLGLVKLALWTRETLGQAKRHEERAIEDKETLRWLLHYQEGNKLAQEMPQTHMVVIGDRESDIYEVLAEAAKAKSDGDVSADLLVRSSHNRRVAMSDGKQGKIRELSSGSSVLGEIAFEMQPRKGEKERKVQQQIRATEIQILPTQRRGDRGEMESFAMTVVHAKEINVPTGATPVEWFLLTTVKVGNDFERACEIIEWYLARWEIELYFKALKSGCKVEEIQLQEAQRFMSCLALYAVIAWRILFLVKIGRTRSELCCSEFLSETEWRTAYVMIRKKKPKHPPTIGEAINIIAQVGGYLARKSDGPPGMKNLWRGLSRIRQVEIYKEIIDDL
jgi:hypothetical protein